jgi:Alginate export
MIRIAAMVAALVAATTSAAAAGSTAAPTAPWPGYTPKMFRWDEDYRSLRDQTELSFFPYRLKYIPLSGDQEQYVSLGGEYRFRVDDYDHPDFGLRSAPDFTSVQQRFLLHADLHLSSTVRFFLQLGGATEEGRKPTARPADQSHADVAQGFLEIGFEPGASQWRLRIGRQEVANGRYIAVRDGTNIRRTFDGVRVDGTISGWDLSALAARATRNQPDAFDDDPDPNDGVYLLVIEHSAPWTGFKVDFLAAERDNYLARYLVGTGVERRRSVGVRLFGANRGWDADGQVSYQFGTFAPSGQARLDIHAWGAAFEGGRSFDQPWRPRLGLRIDAAGGDSDPQDSRLGTFDLPYPNLSYLTDAALFAPRNVHDLQPFVSFTPARDFTVTTGAQLLWRNSRHDAVYSAANFPVVPAGGHGMYVATEPYVRIDWRITPLVQVQGGLVYALPGEALKSFGGTQRLDFAFGSVALRF